MAFDAGVAGKRSEGVVQAYSDTISHQAYFFSPTKTWWEGEQI